MPGPGKHLERTRGRILDDSELVRVASHVRLLSGAGCIEGKARGRLYLGLTNRRLLLVAEPPFRGDSQLLLERPSGRLRISLTRRKLGGNLIQILATDGSGQPMNQPTLVCEWVSGSRPREWASLRFRQ